MTIPAQRFNSLDKQTAIPVANFLVAASSDILNSLSNSSSEITSNMKSFFENSLQVKSVKPETVIDKTIRTAKDGMGSIRDIGSFSDKDLTKLIEGLIPNNATARTLFSKLGNKCSTKGLSSGAIGKPYDTSVDCGGKKRKGKRDGCNSSEYANVLNKVTNGAYVASYRDINGALQNLVALSKFGYDVNLCGVFSSLTDGLDNNVLSRASGALLGYLGGNGNVFGVMDLANSSSGLHVLKEMPGGISNALTNFKLPSEVVGRDLSGLADRYMGAMSMLDSSWDTSKYDSMSSIGQTGEYNSDVDKMLSCRRIAAPLDTSNLDNIPTDVSTFTSTAYSMNGLF